MTSAPVPWPERRGPWVGAAAAAIGALLLLLLVRNVIDHPPMYDELLHVLAARGVVATGEPVIADGRYERGELFTRAMAATFQWRGDSLESARLPALVSTLALIALLGSWVTARAGFLAGTTAALLLAISTSTIGLATFARFYTMHALAMSVMFVSLYEATAVSRPRWGRALLGAAALLAAAIAWHLQITTLIALGAALSGVAAVLAFEMRERLGASVRRHPWLSAMLLIAVVGLLIVLEWRLHLIDRASEVPLWAEGRSGRPLFYVHQLAADFPLFWPLFPLAALATIVAFGRFGVFCTVVVVSALAVHSIAAAKAARYIYYALPLLCAVAGCGVAVAVRLLSGWLARQTTGPARGALAGAIGVVAVSVLLSQEGQRTLRSAAGRSSASSLVMYANETQWTLAMPVLLPVADRTDTVIVSAGVKGLYFLGRYDFELNASAVLETESGKEFGRDPRTGRAIIGTPESLAALLAKHGNKLIVVDQDKLGRETGVAPAVVSLIRRSCEVLSLPSESGVWAWKCRTSEK
jgi:hypothetical protein